MKNEQSKSLKKCLLQDKYDDLSSKYSISAREYFLILGLAIYSVDKTYLESSYKIATFNASEKALKVACELLKTLHNK